MPLLILADPAAASDIRALCLPLLSSADAAVLLPDTLVLGPMLGRQAEALVVRRVGPDWSAIMAGTAPSQYAGGDAALAHDLLYGATVLWTCALTCPLLRQLVPTQERSEVVSAVRSIDWAVQRAEFERSAQATLNLLLPAAVVPALMMAPAGVAPIDPNAIPTVLRPLFGPRLTP